MFYTHSKKSHGVHGIPQPSSCDTSTTLDLPSNATPSPSLHSIPYRPPHIPSRLRSGGHLHLAELPAGGVLQELHVDVFRLDVDEADDGATDEAGGDGDEVRVAGGVDDRDVVELDVEELVDGVERAAEGEVVFELDGDLLVDEGFEKREEEHRGTRERLGEGGTRDGEERCGSGEWGTYRQTSAPCGLGEFQPEGVTCLM
mmetsp:Transcript_5733/g.13879  ORF Transcript_5733/g.13879 Transcript_5733/m.13879 type:complete len:201 (-) Transcript_5733:13-615(-)